VFNLDDGSCGKRIHSSMDEEGEAGNVPDSVLDGVHGSDMRPVNSSISSTFNYRLTSRERPPYCLVLATFCPKRFLPVDRRFYRTLREDRAKRPYQSTAPK
jgi:hypothetical protein